MPVAWINRERLRKTFGWWFGTWILWFSIHLGLIVPTDFHIFRRGRYTTNQTWFFCLSTMGILSDFFRRVMGFLPTNMGILSVKSPTKRMVFECFWWDSSNTDVDVMGYDWDMMRWWGKCNEHVIYHWLNMIFGWKKTMVSAMWGPPVMWMLVYKPQ